MSEATEIQIQNLAFKNISTRCEYLQIPSSLPNSCSLAVSNKLSIVAISVLSDIYLFSNHALVQMLHDGIFDIAKAICHLSLSNAKESFHQDEVSQESSEKIKNMIFVNDLLYFTVENCLYSVCVEVDEYLTVPIIFEHKLVFLNKQPIRSIHVSSMNEIFLVDESGDLYFVKDQNNHCKVDVSNVQSANWSPNFSEFVLFDGELKIVSVISVNLSPENSESSHQMYNFDFEFKTIDIDRSSFSMSDVAVFNINWINENGVLLSMYNKNEEKYYTVLVTTAGEVISYFSPFFSNYNSLINEFNERISGQWYGSMEKLNDVLILANNLNPEFSICCFSDSFNLHSFHQIYIPNEEDQIILPVNEEFESQIPIGIALDLSYEEIYQANQEDDSKNFSTPLLWIISDQNALFCYRIYKKDQISHDFTICKNQYILENLHETVHLMIQRSSDFLNHQDTSSQNLEPSESIEVLNSQSETDYSSTEVKSLDHTQSEEALEINEENKLQPSKDDGEVSKQTLELLGKKNEIIRQNEESLLMQEQIIKEYQRDISLKESILKDNEQYIQQKESLIGSLQNEVEDLKARITVFEETKPVETILSELKDEIQSSVSSSISFNIPLLMSLARSGSLLHLQNLNFKCQLLNLVLNNFMDKISDIESFIDFVVNMESILKSLHTSIREMKQSVEKEASKRGKKLRSKNSFLFQEDEVGQENMPSRSLDEEISWLLENMTLDPELLSEDIIKKMSCMNISAVKQSAPLGNSKNRENQPTNKLNVEKKDGQTGSKFSNIDSAIVSGGDSKQNSFGFTQSNLNFSQISKPVLDSLDKPLSDSQIKKNSNLLNQHNEGAQSIPTATVEISKLSSPLLSDMATEPTSSLPQDVNDAMSLKSLANELAINDDMDTSFVPQPTTEQSHENKIDSVTKPVTADSFQPIQNISIPVSNPTLFNSPAKPSQSFSAFNSASQSTSNLASSPFKSQSSFGNLFSQAPTSISSSNSSSLSKSGSTDAPNAFSQPSLGLTQSSNLSLVDGAPSNAVPAFGATTTIGNNPLFGNPSNIGNPSLFGAAPTFGSTSLFGNASNIGASPLFGNVSTTGSTTNIFGNPSSVGTGSAFGANPSSANNPSSSIFNATPNQPANQNNPFISDNNQKTSFSTFRC